MAYLDMEEIQLTETPDPDLPQMIARALERLRGLFQAPSGFTIGCLGSGIARHALFKDLEAPFSFSISSIEALEKYMNKGTKCARPRNGSAISGETDR